MWHCIERFFFSEPLTANKERNETRNAEATTMEFAGTGLGATQLREHQLALQTVCAQLQLPLPEAGSASPLVARAAARHAERRRAMAVVCEDAMPPFPGSEQALLGYMDPWLADRLACGMRSATTAAKTTTTTTTTSDEAEDPAAAERSNGGWTPPPGIDVDALFRRLPGPCALGSALKSEHFCLPPRQTFLNAGSYGATPRAVLAARGAWEAAETYDPVAFRSDALPCHLRRAQNRVAALVGAHPADLVFVANCNTATSSVLKSLPWEVGDTLLLFSCDYDATKLAAQWLADALGVDTAWIDIVLPLSDAEIVETVENFLTVRQKQGGPRPQLANFCHVTSKTAWIFPAKALTRLFHRFGIPVFIDGAQAAGHIPVNVSDIGADYYTGTCHKWMYACQGVAFLVVAPSKQQLIQPLAPGTERGTPFAQAFALAVQYDCAAFLAVAQAFDFVERICGGWNAVWRYNGQLARLAVAELEREWDLASEGLRCFQTEQMAEGAAECNCLPIVPLPRSRGATTQDATKVMGYLLTRFGITAFLLVDRFRCPDGTVRSVMAVRVTAQIHVSLEDVRRLARAVKELGGAYSALGVMKEHVPDAVRNMIS